MKTQLRPFWTDAELAEIYAKPYDHTRWADHRDRMAWIMRTMREMWPRTDANYPIELAVADLSCGDAYVVRQLIEWGWVNTYELSDIVPNEHTTLSGPIEDVMSLLTRPSGQPSFDLLICTETVEHVRDPESLLAGLRRIGGRLLLTTPIDEAATSIDNPEHYWSFTVEDMRGLLEDAGWKVEHFDRLSTFWYEYQLWWCS